MTTVIEFLQASQVQYLATLGLDGKPKVRPFQFLFEEDGKLWFCTANTKEVFKELQKQPYVELCTSGNKLDWLRMEGKVVFKDNLKIKTRVLKESELIRGIYKVPENPSCEVFYLDEAIAHISSIGKKPQIIEL